MQNHLNLIFSMIVVNASLTITFLLMLLWIVLNAFTDYFHFIGKNTWHATNAVFRFTFTGWISYLMLGLTVAMGAYWGMLLVLYWIAFDIFYNKLTHQEPLYVGTTAFLDKSIRKFSKWLKFTGTKCKVLKFIGSFKLTPELTGIIFKSIVLLLFFVIFVICK